MADESTTLTGGEYRESINDLLYDAYTAARGADAEIDFSDWGMLESDLAAAWKVEEAVQDAFYDLNEKVIAGSATDLEKAARDVIFDKMQEIEENREALKGEGIDPSIFAADRPLMVENWGRGTQERSNRGEEITTGHHSAQQATATANTRAIAQADSANKAGTRAPVEDAELTKDAEGSALVRGTYQCYLLYNLGYYSGAHKELLATKPAGTGYRGISKGHIKTPGYWSDQYGRQKILLMEEERDNSAAMNKLQICAGNEAFAKIKTSEYAQIQPMLKIYKIFSNRKKGMVEMEFGTNTNLDGIAAELSVGYPIGNDSAKLYGRGANSGIKSFEWKFLGTDPFTATRDVEATLKLHFQHFSELLKVRSGLDTTPAQGQTPQGLDYKYLDLIIQPDCRDKDAAKKDTYSRRYAPECYEIRVDVGYHEPGSNMSLSAETKKSIGCQRQSLFLTLVDHKFDFKNDGTFDMTVTYRGRLGTIMRDKKFNVLMPGGGFIEIEFKNPDDPNAPRIGILDLEDRILKERSKAEPSEERLKKYQRWKESFIVQTKQELYNGILDHMGKAGMIFSEPLTTEEWNAFSRWQQGDEAQFALPEPKSAYGGGIPPGGTPDNAQVATQAANTDVDADGTGNPNADVEAQAEAQTARLAKQAKRKKQIDYVFLGDLIAHVYDNVTGERIFQGVSTRARWKVITGLGHGSHGGILSRVRTTSPSSARLLEILKEQHLVLGNIKASLARTGTPEEFVVNIAHIPVSLEVFRQFWTEKVLMQNRTFYSFFEFLDDILQDMLTQAISSGCFGGLLDHAVRAQSALITSTSTINKKVFKRGGLGWKSVHANASTNKNPAFNTLIRETGLAATTPKEYLILQAADTAPHDLHGDYREDLNRGIIHTGYGRDRGLLKSVQFNKTDQEYLPEARYASEGDFVFNQLANVYDATFNLIGNTMFAPGMHIYFDPSDQGIGSPPERKESGDGEVTYQSWSNLMGLGGYHLVTEIANVIDRNGFNTTVKARWVTSGRMR